MKQGSFRFPDNCPDEDCDFLVTYQASGDNSVVFELRGRGNWAGVGFSDDNLMVSNLNLQNRLICRGGRRGTMTDGCVMSEISRIHELKKKTGGCFAGKEGNKNYATCLATLLQNEANSDVARFATRLQTCVAAN